MHSKGTVPLETLYLRQLMVYPEALLHPQPHSGNPDFYVVNFITCWVARDPILIIYITNMQLAALAKHTYANSVNDILEMDICIASLVCGIFSLGIRRG